MHAGVILLTWLIGVILLQSLTGPLLLVALAALTAAVLWFAPKRFLRLLRRIRFLILAIVVLFIWFSPGEALLIDWPRISPTREGVAMAVDHVARLLVVICAVALLLEKLSIGRLAAGLNALSRPFTILGVERQRLALRLLLVLEYVDDARDNKSRHWREWLLAEDDTLQAKPVSMPVERWSWRDALALATLFGLVAGRALW